MSITPRSFGKTPEVRHILPVAKEFTDTAIALDIDDVLTEARNQRAIGRTVARLSGVHLQLEGDGHSKNVVSGAYDNIYDLMNPAFRLHDADEVQEIFNTDTTRSTLLHLSSNVSSYGLSCMAHRYRTQDSYFQLGNNGLELNDDYTIPEKFKANRGGCPYSKAAAAKYFNQFTDRIVETFVEAHRRNMPDSWLESVRRQFISR